ncbi:peptidoglycan-binding protein [Streptomyces sp. NBC_00353]|uniref:peptidoglycan-binding protein n=1 Tax=Streptomyces sp. NBC_00353 TaxID=2975722 RepID=UPI002E2709C3
MTVPAFEEYVPAVDCTCAGCAAQRRAAARALPTRYGGHPAAHGARRALVMVTAAGVVLGSGAAEAASAATGHPAGSAGAAGSVASARADPTPTPADPEQADPSDPGDPDPADLADPGDPADLADPEDSEDSDSDDSESGSPQGVPGPLRGSGAAGPPSSTGSAPETPKTTRTDIINRAKKWVSQQVPYSMAKYWSDGYRQDCSGYVSMAWKLRSNEWTGSLAKFGTKIAREELQPGDILLFHNKANPTNGSHVTIFGGWTDYTHSHYSAYEQTPSHTRKRTTPMAYWSHSGSYIPYRYKGLPTKTGSSSSKALSAFPGRDYFRPGQSNSHVDKLGRQLVRKGYGKHYAKGPGPRWTEEDRRNVEAFQRAQGWRGTEADGYPGPETWQRLFA